MGWELVKKPTRTESISASAQECLTATAILASAGWTRGTTHGVKAHLTTPYMSIGGAVKNGARDWRQIMHQTKVKAFSLFELLVAILIVAILAAILFPVFLKAKEAAKKTGCLQNLRQIGIAHILYSSDHDGWYPPYATTTARGGEGRPWIKGDPEALKKCLIAYKVDEGQFWCPLDPYKGDNKVIGYSESAGVHRNSFMSYQHHWVLTSSPSSFGSVDGAFRFNPDVFPERIRESVFGGGQVTYFHDFTWVKEYKQPSGDPLQASPHRDRANYLTPDGSVHYLNVDQPETVPLPQPK